jgi:hypothetical protein
MKKFPDKLSEFNLSRMILPWKGARMLLRLLIVLWWLASCMITWFAAHADN